MTKQEFLEQLQRALGSRVSSYVVNENVFYYEEYIATQVRAGKNESDVIAELGDPRLLARSIADADKRAGKVEGECIDEEITDQGEGSVKRYNIPGWLITTGIVLLVVLVLSAVFKVVTVLLPLIIPVAIIVFFLRSLQSK